MIAGSWHWVSSSVRGTSHLAAGTECQDSHLCVETDSEGGPVLIALASDGAGSAKRGAEGSRLLCETLRDQAEQFFREHGSISQINARLVANWVEQFRSEVILLADSEGLSDREYACTLLGAIAGLDSSCFFQVGDGAIVYSVAPGGPYVLCFWPDRGEYENTTHFATEATFYDQMQFRSTNDRVKEIAILSDGLQRIALNYQTKEAHEPFFRGFFPRVRSAERAELPAMSEQLCKFLDSPRVNERTDDDKTLILAIAR